MNSRMRVLGLFALVGFIAGTIANLSAGWIIENLSALLPWLLSAQWIFWGFVGALLAMVAPVIWAYISPSSD